MKRKMLWAILVALFLVEIWDSYRQIGNMVKQVNQVKSETDKLAEESNFLSEEIEQMIAGAGAMVMGYHLPTPTNGVKITLHDNYDDAWIQDIDKEKGLVLVTTVDSKTDIIFKPTADNLEKFRIGSIAAVTFQCTKQKKGKCDFNSPYKLFVRNGLVEMKDIQFLKK